MDYRLALFQFLGGLGLFLFSIKYMGDGLQMTTGEKIRHILDKYTTNPFLGILTGIIVTVLIQSSSGTTVILVGLVAAGLLNLRQAIGIIMGANIGTTLTTFIIGFNLSEYALPILFIGAALLFFTKKIVLNNIGRIFYGFGGIFFALTLMSSAMQPLKFEPWFTKLMLDLSNSSVLGVAVGTGLTMLIQASSATIGIIQNLYADHLITLGASLPVIFGNNIGTTITVIIACIGATAIAKRVALSHVLINIVGTIVFLIFLNPFTNFLAFLQTAFAIPPKLVIALSHIIFNITSSAILFPFITQMEQVALKIFPTSEDEEMYRPEYLDEKLLLNSPIVAIGNAKKELEVMLGKAITNFSRSTEYFQTRNPQLSEKVVLKEEEINTLDQQITKYLTTLFRGHISERDGEVSSALLDASRDIERIGDHAIGLVREVDIQIRKNLDFSGIAKDEVKILTDITTKMLNLTLEAFKENSKAKAIEALDLFNDAYAFEKKSRKNHINRLNKGECDIMSGLYYVDITSHYTRICDHSRNIAEKIINDQI